MPVPLLDLRAQHALIKDEVVGAMMRVVDDQLFILGAPVQQLEEAVARLSHTAHAIGCASGTDALLLALRALDIGRGDEVVTTPFTFFATAGTDPQRRRDAGFRATSIPTTFNMVPAAAAAACTSRTKAIVPVDLFGQMAAIEDIAATARGIPIIEDAAQTIGASRMIDGERRMAGEVATIGTFSFFPSKNLGGYGDGGMMVTQDETLATRLKRLRMHGGCRCTTTMKSASTAGSTRCRPRCCTPSSDTCRTGARRRRANAAYYTSAFADVADVRTPVVDPANESIFNQYTHPGRAP